MNNIELSGRLVRDPEMKHVGTNGTKLCSFSIAQTMGEGQYKKPHYFDAKSWKERAEEICANYRKGDAIEIRGMLQQETWTDKDGQKRSKVVIVVMDHRVPGERGDDDRSEPAPARTVPVTNARSGAGGYASRSPSAPPPGDIDVPF